MYTSLFFRLTPETRLPAPEQHPRQHVPDYHPDGIVHEVIQLKQPLTKHELAHLNSQTEKKSEEDRRDRPKSLLIDERQKEGDGHEKQDVLHDHQDSVRNAQEGTSPGPEKIRIDLPGGLDRPGENRRGDHGH